MPFPTSSMPGELLPDQQIGAQGLQSAEVQAGEEILYEMLRFWPPVGVSIPAISTEPLIIKARGTRADASFLSAEQMTEIGFEAALHDGESSLVWLPLEGDDARNETAPTGWVFFSILIGPDAQFTLLGGAYYLTVRTATVPRAARNLPLLTIDPP